jgi:FkbM family methyltransferase
MNYTFMEKLFAAIRRPDLPEMAQYVRTDAPTIVEAGAFDGRHTRAFAERWPKGHFYAFEPHPLLAAKVRANTRGLPNATVIEAGLTDRAASNATHNSFADSNSIQ